MFKTKLLLPVIAVLTTASCSPSGGFVIDPSKSSTSTSNYENHDSYNAFMLNAPKKAFNSSDAEKPNQAYVDSLNSLSKDLYNKLFDDDNKIYSTISIANCFSMLYEGAKEESKAELESFLHYDGSFNHREEIKKTLLRNAIDDKKLETYLDITQSFWSDTSFRDDLKQTYIDTLTNYYFAEAFNGDLSSDAMHGALADYINDKTRGFLNVKKDDFKDFGGVLWLLNTIYLKSQWSEVFQESANIKDEFTNLDTSKKEVTFMRKSEEGMYQKKDTYVIASLPMRYGLCFNVLLPNKDSNYKNVLTNETALNDLHNFTSYKHSKDSVGATINFKVPQFKIQKSIDLTSLLQKMGVNYIFDRDLANLRDIANLKPNENLFVSKAKHEAGIELKNEGLEAAAYTIIEVSKATSVDPGPMKYIDFFMDRPFAYTVTNQDGIALFTGVVTNLQLLNTRITYFYSLKEQYVV